MSAVCSDFFPGLQHACSKNQEELDQEQEKVQEQDYIRVKRSIIAPRYSQIGSTQEHEPILGASSDT